MTPAAGLGILLLLTAQPQLQSMPAPRDLRPDAAAHIRFAPPVGQSMTYRVTTRRVSRDGTLINFALVYALQWQQAGRGYRLEAVLQRIDSDARPEVTRALASILEPLVGEQIAYLVASDGSRVDLVDPDRLWERVIARTEAAGAAAGRPEAQQIAKLIGALPPAERDELAAADIRALVAPANDAIPSGMPAGGASVSISRDGALQTIAKVERDSVVVGGKVQPLAIDSLWTVDTGTGLVLRERRQSWIVEADSEARTLVEERVRALELAP